MKKFNTNKPKPNKWYLVKCPDYCESGLQVARFEDDKWLDAVSDDITIHVKSWSLITTK